MKERFEDGRLGPWRGKGLAYSPFFTELESQGNLDCALGEGQRDARRNAGARRLSLVIFRGMDKMGWIFGWEGVLLQVVRRLRQMCALCHSGADS